jgi:hypothetical protein
MLRKFLLDCSSSLAIVAYMHAWKYEFIVDAPEGRIFLGADIKAAS